MFTRIRPFAAAGLLAAAVVAPVRADGDIEKPPGVPPEVQAAKCACPTLHGPCSGFYPTRWRVLADCCSPVPPIVVAPARPTALPTTPDVKPAPKPGPVEGKPPVSPSKLQPAGGCGTFVYPDDRERGMFPPPAPPARPVAVEVVPVSGYNPKR